MRDLFGSDTDPLIVTVDSQRVNVHRWISEVSTRAFTDGGSGQHGYCSPMIPGQRPVVDVAVVGGKFNTGPGDLDRVPVDRGLEIGLRARCGQVDATVADVDHPLVGDGALVLVDELAVVADPHRPFLRHVAVPVGGVAHQGGLFLAHHDVRAGAGDPVRVADVVAAAVGGVVAGDGGAVLLHHEAVRVSGKTCRTGDHEGDAPNVIALKIGVAHVHESFS